MKIYKVKVLASAHNNIKSIYKFCKSCYGLNYAKKVRETIRQAINGLKIFPYSNPIYLIHNNNIFRKRIVNGRYIIVFKIYYNFIHVYYVYDGRQNITESNLFFLQN